MSSPENPSQQPSRPTNAGRSVTAPQLDQALQQELSTHRSLHQFLEEYTHPSTDSSKQDGSDKINDLSKSRSNSQSSSSPTEPPASKISFPTRSSWRTYFMQEVATDRYLEAQLLLMTLTTGVLDAMTYSTYGVFASKQTGNTLFLALYASGHEALGPGFEKNVGISISVFILGAAFFGHLGHVSRQKRRVWLLVSNAFQALLMLAAAAIRYFVSRHETGSGALAILALLSFAEAGQIATALNVGMPELNTTMITGALIQLCTDRRIFAWRNVKRNRRLAFFASILAGGFVGAGTMRWRSPSAALVVAAAIKGFLVITFLGNRGLVEKTKVLEDGGHKVEGTATPATRVLWGD
ncbi:unnamed protein product [Zymoseptoria tritici ST99CH_1A5]|uniref:DUF1275 domain protein n=1 Tax=Zymoseptoria tritici ST99CH_1A5 TaxID=1276529 RepID=A0A1Y6L7K5_ZYMTR|nr:unnamed protein product [Zymoseptoria tritici ST99CH_1A5]